MATETTDNKGFIARFKEAGFAAALESGWAAIFTRLEAIEKRETPAAFDPKPLNDKIAALEDKLSKMPTEAQVKEWAEAAASLKAIDAVSSVGHQATVIAPANPTNSTTTANTSDKLIAEGKYEEAWVASPAIQAEFGEAKVYAAYMRAAVSGKIKQK